MATPGEIGELVERMPSGRARLPAMVGGVDEEQVEVRPRAQQLSRHHPRRVP
jgi:hypothetical protein